MTGESWRGRARRVLDVAFLALIFLAPLKFGTLLGHSGAPFFPMSFLEWVLGYWPASIWSAVPGILLLAVLVIDGIPSKAWLRRQGVLLLPAFLLMMAAILGCLRGTEMDFSIQFCRYLAGVFCFATALLLHLRVYPELRRGLLIALVAGGLWTAGRGWYEALVGREQQKDAYIARQEELGQPVDKRMLHVLGQNRILGTFGNPGLYGSYLILVLPAALALLWRWGGHVDPPGPSRIVVTSLAGGLFFGALLMTGSRAPPLAFGGAIIGTFILLGFFAARPVISRRLLLGGLAAVVVVMALSLLILQRRRNVLEMATIRQRLHYWETSVEMWQDAPVLGLGVGEWYPHYLRRKPGAAEETRMPHNFVFFWLTQTGVVGLLLALPFLLQPLFWWGLWRSGRLPLAATGRLALAVFLGVSAWLLQSLADFIMVSPALLMILTALPLLVIDTSDAEAPLPRRTWAGLLVILVPTALLACWSLARMPGERGYQALYERIRNRPTDARYLEDEVESLAATMPHSPYPWVEWGKLALSQQQGALAELAFEQAIERAPHRAAFHGFLAQALLLQRRPEAALAAVRKAQEWYPTGERYRDLARQIEAIRQLGGDNDAQ